MSTESNDLLRDAVCRNAGVVLSLPSSGMLRHHKSRFLGEVDGHILIESVVEETPLIQELIVTGKQVGVSFKGGQVKVVFASPLVEHLTEHRMNGDSVICAVRMEWPTNISAIQRRSNYRVTVGRNTVDILSARVWRISPRAFLRDRPNASAELGAKLRDLSTGGMGVTMTARTVGEPLKIDPADRLRVEISYEGRQILLDAHLRHPQVVPKDTTTLRAGIQFSALESSLEGRQTMAQLTKIIGELQRAEVRNARLGLMNA